MIYINKETKPVNITGEEETWDRAKLITIDNTYNQNPKITIIDDRITISPLGETHKILPSIFKELTVENELTQFNIVNPTTGEIIRTSTYQELQIMMFSLYKHLKEEQELYRLNNPEPEPIPEEII